MIQRGELSAGARFAGGSRQRELFGAGHTTAAVPGAWGFSQRLFQHIDEAMENTRIVTAEIERLLRGIEIPPCPGILTALQEEIRRADPDQARIGQLISHDVALSAGLLKIANSDLFVPARQATTVGEALALLGVGRAFQWVINALLMQTFASGPEQRFERFWNSAAYMATACARLALTLPGVTREDVG
jgi:HD-like signal output (HDOD) protein